MKKIVLLLLIIYVPIMALIPSGVMPNGDTPDDDSVLAPRAKTNLSLARANTVSGRPVQRNAIRHTMSVSNAPKMTHGFTKRLPNAVINSPPQASQVEDAEITGTLRNHPNPTRFNVEGTTIAYYLNQDLDITLKIFNSAGYEILQKEFNAGQNGGSGTLYNEIPLTSSDFGSSLSAGIYFYTISANGTRLAKSKMAVLP